jgi:hypothetical protein
VSDTLQLNSSNVFTIGLGNVDGIDKIIINSQTSHDTLSLSGDDVAFKSDNDFMTINATRSGNHLKT